MGRNLAFIDIESTGLDPLHDKILEVGIVIWNPLTREAVAEQNWVGHLSNSHIEIMWDDMPDVVKNMHNDNGLWYEVIHKSFHYITEFSDEVIDFMSEHDAVGGPMCGNSVHFDRAFLTFNETDKMPGVVEMFNHRNIDISTFHNTATLVPNSGLVPAPKGIAHRAVQDCHDSIRQFKDYLEQIG